ncbi:MAG: ACT domain-containing protein [Acidobacteriota bacterium]
MKNPAELLARSKVAVAPETFALVSVTPADFARLMQDPELSPRMTAPFMLLKDAFEVTMLLDDTDFGTMRHAIRDAKVERGYRLLTFDIELDPGVVGFMAEISRILADAAIPILAISAFTRDHLLIRQHDLATALNALGPHVAELC